LFWARNGISAENVPTFAISGATAEIAASDAESTPKEEIFSKSEIS